MESILKRILVLQLIICHGTLGDKENSNPEGMVVFKIEKSILGQFSGSDDNRTDTDLASPPGFLTQALQVQNCYRRKHGASDLQLDPKVNQFSQRYAETLAARDSGLQHSNSGYGENLFAAGPPGNNFYPITNGGLPIYYWYKEMQDVNYNFNINSGQGAGHFTQVVWKSSQRCGFGVASGRRYVYFVGNYDPPGNNGQYTQNVGRPSDNNIKSCLGQQVQPEDFIDPENILIA